MKLAAALTPIRRVPQIRQYRPEPVPDDVLDQLLELARWTGSSRNLQPWQLIVVRDRATLREIAKLRPNIAWLAEAPAGIAVVLDGNAPASEAYDEGRLTERVLTGAGLLGYGGGTAWFGEPEHQTKAKEMLGIPAEKTARQIIAIGRPVSARDPRPSGPKRGRKPLADLVSYERLGRRP